MTFTIARPEVELALLKRLGEPPFWPSHAASFLGTLQAGYEAVTRAALELAFGDEAEQDSPL